ncbi:hypothetical protein D3C76_669880 [compost metagenome]
MAPSASHPLPRGFTFTAHLLPVLLPEFANMGQQTYHGSTRHFPCVEYEHCPRSNRRPALARYSSWGTPVVAQPPPATPRTDFQHCRHTEWHAPPAKASFSSADEKEFAEHLRPWLEALKSRADCLLLPRLRRHALSPHEGSAEVGLIAETAFQCDLCEQHRGSLQQRSALHDPLFTQPSLRGHPGAFLEHA